jgi:inorganic pyrophosphatase
MKTPRSNTAPSALPGLHALHPWHGIDPRVDGSGLVCAFIEIVPGADFKFELDKPSGWLRVDRPQRYASRPPAMYGLIPRTCCATQVGQRGAEMTGISDLAGDGDPMDIVVLAESAPPFGGFLVHARIVGGLRMIDRHEADDKLIAVLDGDPVYGSLQHISDVPHGIVDRLLHYFSTYKQKPGASEPQVTIPQIYDRGEAELMLALSLADYSERFLVPEPNIEAARGEHGP